MEFYLEALNRQERLSEENAPISIIICRYKNKTVVEYALSTASRPTGVATYTVVPELPEAYRAELPSPETIAERLQAWSELEVSDDRTIASLHQPALTLGETIGSRTATSSLRAVTRLNLSATSLLRRVSTNRLPIPTSLCV